MSFGIVIRYPSFLDRQCDIAVACQPFFEIDTDSDLHLKFLIFLSSLQRHIDPELDIGILPRVAYGQVDFV